MSSGVRCSDEAPETINTEILGNAIAATHPLGFELKPGTRTGERPFDLDVDSAPRLSARRSARYRRFFMDAQPSRPSRTARSLEYALHLRHELLCKNSFLVTSERCVRESHVASHEQQVNVTHK